MRLRIHGPRARLLLTSVACLAAAWIAALTSLPHLLGVRDRLAARLARQLGHPVHLGSVRLTWLGAVQLNNLRVGSPDRPWLVAPHVAVDLVWLDLIRGSTTIRSISTRHAQLDLERNPNGHLNALPEPRPPAAPAHSPTPRSSSERKPIQLLVSNSTLLFADHPTQTRLQLTQLNAELFWSTEAIELDTLTAHFNGGRLALAARLELSPTQASASGELLVEDAEIDPALGALGFLVPIGPTSSLTTARLDLRLRLHSEANSLAHLAESISGGGQLALRDIQPTPGSLIATLSERVAPPSRRGPASMAGSFSIDPQGITTHEMRLLIGTFPIAFAGRTSLDGTLDYTIRAEGLAATIDRYGSRLPDRARRTFHQLDLPKKLQGIADLHLGGWAGSPTLSLSGPASSRETLLDAATLERFAERLRRREPARR